MAAIVTAMLHGCAARSGRQAPRCAMAANRVHSCAHPRREHHMLANDAFHIAVLPGDGIGPEVMAPALEMLRKVAAATPGLNFRFTEARGRRRPLSRPRQVDAGNDDQAVRGGRRHPARRLRAAVGALSRQHRDHAAGRTALHLRPLCRRAAVPAHPRHPVADRRRRRARHRPRRHPRIDRGHVRLDGQGRGHARRGARDAGDHAQDLRAAVRRSRSGWRSGGRRAGCPAGSPASTRPTPSRPMRSSARCSTRRRRSIRTSPPTASMSTPAPPCW